MEGTAIAAVLLLGGFVGIHLLMHRNHGGHGSAGGGRHSHGSHTGPAGDVSQREPDRKPGHRHGGGCH